MNAINLVGGGGQSAVWSQIFADTLGVEVRQVRDAIQANARGAAWIAAVGLGEIAFPDVPGLVGIEEVFEPQAADRAVYDERFAAFSRSTSACAASTGGSIATRRPPAPACADAAPAARPSRHAARRRHDRLPATPGSPPPAS